MPTSPLQYRAQMRAARARLAALQPQTITTEHGPVCYLDQGSGPPVLLVHGIFGGHDAALRLAGAEDLAGHRRIAPSRFGYLCTPLPPGATVPAQADAHAALLDVLGVDRAVVLAGSAGVTSALQLAIRHPDRVAGLVLISSNAPGPQAERDPMPRWLARTVWGSDLLMWLVRTYLSGAITSLMGIPKGLPLTAQDRARIDEELDGIFPVSARIDGILFDAYAGNKDINHDYPLEAITAPTLVIHARDDSGAPYQAAAGMAARIPGARLVTLEHGGHLGLGNHPEVPEALRQFLDKHSLSGAPRA